MPPALLQALQHARTLYLTTYGRRGQTGTVPVWFLLYQDRLYFCTLRESLKVRRMQHTGTATIHIGHRNGYRVDCTATILPPDTALQSRLLQTYRRRYPIRWLWIGRRLRQAFAEGREVIVQLTPQP